MVPGCPFRHGLEYHHIRPWGAGGESTAENGIILCRMCHGDADNGILTCALLLDYKKRPFSLAPRVLDHVDTEELLDPASLDSMAAIPKGRVRSEGTLRLAILRSCLTEHDVPLERVWRAIAGVQLTLGGSMTSLLQSDGIPKLRSERFEINTFAWNALRIGNELRDQTIQLGARHVLAVNANATDMVRESARQAGYLTRLLEAPRLDARVDRAYVARNNALIFAKAGQIELARHLIRRADEFSRAAGRDGEPENRMRAAQVEMLAGNMRQAERDIGATAGQSVCLTRIQQVISARIQAGHLALAGEVSEAVDLLGSFVAVAEANHLGHQLGKLRNAIRYISSRWFKCYTGSAGARRLACGHASKGVLRLF